MGNRSASQPSWSIVCWQSVVTKEADPLAGTAEPVNDGSDADLTSNVPLMPSDGTESPTATRNYDSPVRRQQVEETRERILAAGSELAHSLPVWDWRELTVRAVARCAGVGVRTVYRYFPTEQHLQAAVMGRLEERAGVEYDGMALGNVASVAAKVFGSLKSFSVNQTSPESDDPAISDADQRRRRALVRAVRDVAPRWSEESVMAAASAVDVLWSVEAYSRLARRWNLDDEHAADVLDWLIVLAVRAIENGEHPRIIRRQPLARRPKRS
jgi:AcrR family transcriptional regulator